MTTLRVQRLLRILGLATFVALLAVPLAAAQGQVPGGGPLPGERVEPVATAVVNLADIAAQEALNPPVSGPLPRAIHVPLTRPEPGDPTQVADQIYFPSGPVPNIPSPSPAANFNALDDAGTTIPPDTMGAVGGTRLLTMLNDNYRVQDKTGGVIATASLSSFWASTGATGVFDPRVLYDSINSRWIVAAVSNASTASSSLLVGVSQTSDPAGAFHLFRFDADALNTNWADFPTIGFNKNWIAVGINMFTIAANAFVAGEVYIMDYPAARGGTSTMTRVPGGGFTMQPALTHSSTETTLYMVEHVSSASGTYNFYTITGTPSSPTAAIFGPFTNSLGGWTQPGGDPLPQSGTATGINVGDARIGNVVFRNGSLWYAQTIGLPAGELFTRTAVQWVKLNTSGGFVDGGRIDDPTATSTNGGAWYAYPSIAVNVNNDVLLGFGRFSSTTFASGAYTFRASADAAGTMRDPVVYKAGLGSYTKFFSGTRNRWGDYSMTTVDPTDDATFWTIQEYAKAPSGSGTDSGIWGTWWAKVSPDANTTPTISDIGNQPINLNTSTGALAFTVGDAETPAESLTLAGASSNTMLAPTANIVFGGTGASRTVTVTPVTGQTGTATITVTVTDGGGLTANDTFLLLVNGPPTIADIGDRTINRDTSTGAVAFTIADAESLPGELTLGGTSSNTTLVPNANIVLGGGLLNRTVTVTPAAGQVGTATITVTVTDTGGLTASDTFLLTVVVPPPTVTITTPTSAATTTATSPFLAIAGSATGDNTITSVTWTTDRGFSGGGAFTGPVNADAADTRTWRADIPLVAGTNIVTVTATDGVSATGTDTLTVTVSSFVYYLAEGATGPFFDLELALANSNGTDAPVTIQYLKEDGTTGNQSLTLTAQSRQTILVDGLAGLTNTAVSTVITSDNALPLAVERTMTWDTTGYGAHTEKATPGAQLTWYFAEGSEQGFFDTYLLLANPQAAANRATVQFLVEGGSPVTKVYDLLPTSRTNVFAGDVEEPAGTKVLVEKAFGIVVTFDQPGVAERAMYFGTTPFWNGGHESAGVNAPSMSWFHAEGATGPFFDTFILLSNPNATPASVTLTFLLDSGATVTRTKTVPANARLTVIVESEDALLANAAMATQVTSTVPIVSERAMYWAAFPNWYEAHNSFGVTATGTRWALGEGRVGGPNGHETYILLANPGATAATVTLTYLREGGLPPLVLTKTVNPTSRFNVLANSDGLGDGERFGVLIESTVAIAVERAVYSNSTSQPGLFWAAGTNASATPIP